MKDSCVGEALSSLASATGMHIDNPRQDLAGGAYRILKAPLVTRKSKNFETRVTQSD